MGLLGSTIWGAEGGLQLPPIDGELTGDFIWSGIAGSPPLHWTLTLRPIGAGRSAVLVAEGPGARLRVTLAVDGDGAGTWEIVQAETDLTPWLAGRASRGKAFVTGTGSWNNGVLEGELALEVTDVDLADIVKLSDPGNKYFRSAQGRVAGAIRLGLRAGEISVGAGHLEIPEGTTAIVAFQPSPGLLTSYVPAQVAKIYPGLGAIEEGRTPLEARVLRLVFQPEPDADGRRAKIRLEGRPLDPKLIAPLELDINVSGPLESVLRRAFDSRLHIGGAP